MAEQRDRKERRLEQYRRWHAEHPERMAFDNARNRCTNPKHRAWKNYGGRGIRFLFTSFEQFFAEVGPRPAGMTLDRKDNNGDYAPGNVRWATWSEQNNNRRPHCGPLGTEARGARIKTGLRNARAKGVRLGRPRRTLDLAEITDLRESGYSWCQVGAEMGVDPSLACRIFAREGSVKIPLAGPGVSAFVSVSENGESARSDFVS